VWCLLLTLLLGFCTLEFVLYHDVEYLDLVDVVFLLMSLCKEKYNNCLFCIMMLNILILLMWCFSL
jgi:hypothetical protein